MLIVTAKLPRRLLTLGCLVTAVLVCAGAVLPAFSPTLLAGAENSVPSTAKVRSNADRVAYLAEYGWEVSPEPLSTEELLIPAEMDESYQEYLDLQLSQGFDLTQYAGKRVKRYTYEIYNYPSGETGVQANLLIHRSAVIGGEVLSPRLNGFLHGLAMP